MDIEECAHGNFWGQLIKKWNFQECSRKSNVEEFPWVLVFNHLWNFQGLSHSFAELPQVKVFFSEISKGKVTNQKIPVGWGGLSEKHIISPHCLDFIWNSPIMGVGTLYWQLQNQIVANCTDCFKSRKTYITGCRAK